NRSCNRPGSPKPCWQVFCSSGVSIVLRVSCCAPSHLYLLPVPGSTNGREANQNSDRSALRSHGYRRRQVTEKNSTPQEQALEIIAELVGGRDFEYYIDIAFDAIAHKLAKNALFQGLG